MVLLVVCSLERYLNSITVKDFTDYAELLKQSNKKLKTKNKSSEVIKIINTFLNNFTIKIFI